MSTNHGGKGDKRRPLVIPEEQFNSNWDNIFKKPNPLADKLVKQIEESIKNEKQFFEKAKEVARQIDNNEYHTPED